MAYFSSVWFRIVLALAIFIIIYGIMIYLTKDRILKRFSALPEEKRLKLFQSFSHLIVVYKILFWVWPIYLILVPLLIYFYLYEEFFLVVTAVVVMYLAILVGFLYSRMILQATRNGK